MTLQQAPESATSHREGRLAIVLIWAVSHLVVLGAAVVGSWQSLPESDRFGAYVGLWRQWDTNWFESIALYGYVGPYVSEVQNFHYNVAFFPAVPMLMEAGTWVGFAPTLSGLLVSLVASLFAAFGIARLTQDVGGRPVWGVVAMLVAPTALFLTAAYTEALFAAFAIWAWAFARKQSWVWAGVLAGGAALVRSNGLFLMAGLIVMFLMSRPWAPANARRAWAKGSALLLPLVATFAYFAYLKAITGSWTTWSEAQSDYWERHLVDPATSLMNTYHLIFTFSPTGEPSSRMATEILAMAILVAAAVVLVVKRWWPEAVYVAVTAAALGTSTMYHSVPRSIVILFPIWMLLGLWLSRYRWLRWVYVIACVPMLVLVTIRFTQSQWIS